MGSCVLQCDLTRGETSFHLDALVAQQLDVEILAGNPFLVSNDIAVRRAKNQILIGDSEIVQYDSKSQVNKPASARRTQAVLLCNPSKAVILPGEYLELTIPPRNNQ